MFPNTLIPQYIQGLQQTVCVNCLIACPRARRPSVDHVITFRGGVGVGESYPDVTLVSPKLQSKSMQTNDRGAGVGRKSLIVKSRDNWTVPLFVAHGTAMIIVIKISRCIL